MLPTTNDENCSSTPHTNFSNLSLDIILAIADHLPASSVICLALTCRQLYDSRSLWHISVRNRNWLAFSDICVYLGYDCCPCDGNHSHDCLDFIRMLRRDLPTYLLCEICRRFHPKSMPKSSRPGRDWLFCPRAPRSAMWIWWPEYRVRLQFEDVQMVMNQHRWGGSHGVPLSSISIDTDWEVMRDCRSRLFLGKFSLEPEIVDGNLLIHTEEHVFFTARQLRETSAYAITGPIDDAMQAFGTCRHASARTQLQESIWWLLIECVPCADRKWPVVTWGHARKSPGWEKSEIVQCAECCTRSCVEVAYHNDNFRLRGGFVDKKHRTPVQGVELILHSWMHLGDGEHALSWLNLCLRRGTLYPKCMYQKVKNPDEASRNDRLREARVRYDRITLSSSTFGRPSLLPSKNCVAAMDSYDPKRRELEAIFRTYDFKCSDICKTILVASELGRPVVKDYFVSQAEFKNLMAAREIIREYKHITTPRWIVKAWLWLVFFDKLFFGLLIGSSADPDAVFQKVHVWPWDKPR